MRLGFGNWTRTDSFKLFAFRLVGMVVGLGSASIAYQTVALIGVAVSNAETVGDLNVVWFPIRMLVAVSAARVSGGWVYGLRLRKRLFSR